MAKTGARSLTWKLAASSILAHRAIAVSMQSDEIPSRSPRHTFSHYASDNELHSDTFEIVGPLSATPSSPSKPKHNSSLSVSKLTPNLSIKSLFVPANKADSPASSSTSTEGQLRLQLNDEKLKSSTLLAALNKYESSVTQMLKFSQFSLHNDDAVHLSTIFAVSDDNLTTPSSINSDTARTTNTSIHGIDSSSIPSSEIAHVLSDSPNYSPSFLRRKLQANSDLQFDFHALNLLEKKYCALVRFSRSSSTNMYLLQQKCQNMSTDMQELKRRNFELESNLQDARAMLAAVESGADRRWRVSVY